MARRWSRRQQLRGGLLAAAGAVALLAFAAATTAALLGRAFGVDLAGPGSGRASGRTFCTPLLRLPRVVAASGGNSIGSRSALAHVGGARTASVVRAAEGVGGSAAPLAGLEAVIVGAGPSGLLLAHRLLQAGATVELFEGRNDPRSPEAQLEGRAYALGLGIRGRTAIRTVDDDLWQAIQPSGFGSEWFQLHPTPTLALDLRTPDDGEGLEPSLLIYQTDLCGAMLDELEARYGSSGRLRTTFQAAVESVDPVTGTVTVASGTGAGGEEKSRREIGPVGIIAGCDGVNSVVREAISESCRGFSCTKKPLPGNLKVIRFPTMPKALEPSAVHAIPGAGGSSAFMEPTSRGVCALINWRDAPAEGARGSGEKKSGAAAIDLGALKDAAEAQEALAKTFPLLEDVLDLDAGRQFVEQSPSRAATVRCNTYHFGRAVLVGDSAHSSGGASGQGCNAALQDAASLTDALIDAAAADGSKWEEALLAYSRRRVPEGHALLDLSLGPSEDAGPLRKALYGLSTFVGTVLSRFGIGAPPLQTQATTTMTPFAEMRRERDFYFGEFPSSASFDETITALAAEMPVQQKVEA